MDKNLNFKSYFGCKLIIIIRLIFLFSVVFILLKSISLSVDYQDQWDLKGLELPYIVFIITYLVYVCFENRLNMIVLFTVVSRLTFCLIPILKYDFFLGRSIDQHMQFSLANFILNYGEIADKNFLKYSYTVKYYLGVPVLHLSLGIYSIISGMTLNQSFKYLPVMWNTIYPLLTYYIVKHTVINNNKNVFKYVLFLSSIPFSLSITYLITGSLLIFIFSYYILSQVLKIINKKDLKIRDILIYLVLITAAITSHSLFTLHFIVFLLTITFVYDKFLKKIFNRVIYRLFSLSLVMNIWWLAYQEIPIEMLNKFLRARGISKSITPTFYELYQLNIISTLKIMILYYGVDIFITLSISLILVMLILNHKKYEKYKAVYQYMIIMIIALWCLSGIGFILGISNKYWERVFRMTYLVYPFLYFLFYQELSFTKIKKHVMFGVFAMTIILASVQFYSPPFLIPAASTVFPDVSSDEPLVYRGRVNSIYQREMVYFAEKYVRGMIACDAVTRNQIRGLTDREFSYSYLLRYYPPDKMIFPDIEEKDYRYLLTHLPGVSGAFEERAIIRSDEVILNMIYDESNNIIYTNGESFILFKLK